MNCALCKHWQGNRYTQWADCYWVIGQIQPKLFEEKNDRDFYFTIPFDPHSVSDFHYNRSFHTVYKQVLKTTQDKIRIEKIKGLIFIQTRRDYSCKYYESR